MKRDDDSHSMSNSPFQVLSMVMAISSKIVKSWRLFISTMWFIFGCLGVPLVSPNLCVINIDPVWKLGSEWKSIKVGVKLSCGWWCLGPLSDRSELVLSMLLCQWDEMWALVAGGLCRQWAEQRWAWERRETVATRLHQTQPGAGSSPHTMWMNLSLSVSQSKPAIMLINQWERAMTGTRPAAFGPAQSWDGPGTGRGEPDNIQTTYSNSVHTFTRPGPAFSKCCLNARFPRSTRLSVCMMSVSFNPTLLVLRSVLACWLVPTLFKKRWPRV